MRLRRLDGPARLAAPAAPAARPTDGFPQPAARVGNTLGVCRPSPLRWPPPPLPIPCPPHRCDRESSPRAASQTGSRTPCAREPRPPSWRSARDPPRGPTSSRSGTMSPGRTAPTRVSYGTPTWRPSTSRARTADTTTTPPRPAGRQAGARGEGVHAQPGRGRGGPRRGGGRVTAAAEAMWSRYLRTTTSCAAPWKPARWVRSSSSRQTTASACGRTARPGSRNWCCRSRTARPRGLSHLLR